MCTLDSSIVNASLPAIARHFGVPVGAAVEWVISVAIAGAVFGTLGGADAGRALLRRPHDPALSATFAHGDRTALLVCAAIAALGIVTSLLRGSEHRR